MIVRLLIALSISAPFALPQPARAQDEALYDPVPPRDSAYVRIIDAACEGNLEVSIGGRSIPVGEGGISYFVPIKAGSYPVTATGGGGVDGSVTIEPGKAYSIVVRGRTSPVTALQDVIEANPDKSAVYLYNLTAREGAELFAPKANVAIVPGVPAEKSGFRSVNAVTVDTEVRLGGQVIEKLPQQTFRRRAGQTYVVCDVRGAPKVVYKRNEAAR